MARWNKKDKDSVEPSVADENDCHHEFHPDTVKKLQEGLSDRGQCLKCGGAFDKEQMGIFAFDKTEEGAVGPNEG
jgi:hypothetical protein